MRRPGAGVAPPARRAANLETAMRLQTYALAFALALVVGLSSSAAEAQRMRRENPETFSAGELVESGHNFFGNISRGLALTIQEAVRRWGEPNGYILGQEASGAFFGGLR